MNGAAPPGWPFLIARGRRRGYSTLLAPRDLVAERDYGVLEDAVGPVDGFPFRVASATSARGRRLSLVWAEHAVTTADLASAAGASAGASAGAAAGARPVRDEHSRPLRLLYGFACAPATVTGPVEADLAHCREAALGAYRRFLADEDGFTVEGSTPFRLASAVSAQPTASSQPAPAVSTFRRRPAAGAPAAGRGMAVQGAAVAFGVLVAVVAAGVVWLHNSPAGGPPACPTAPPASQAPTPGGQPGNPTGGPSPGGAPPQGPTPGGSSSAGGAAPAGPTGRGNAEPATGATEPGRPGGPAPAGAAGTPASPNPPPGTGPAAPGQVLPGHVAGPENAATGAAPGAAPSCRPGTP